MMQTAFINEARRYRGVAYQHQGRSKAGLDCVGLVILAGQTVGALPSDFALPAYTEPPRPTLFDEFLPQFCQPVALDWLPGDLLVFAHRRGGKARHLGIATERGVLWIDRTRSLARVTECRLDAQLRALVLGAWRFKAFGPVSGARC
jgi:hypothetical protein